MTGCMFRATATQIGDVCVVAVQHPSHNHEPLPRPSVLAAYRERTDQDREDIRRMTESNIPTRAIIHFLNSRGGNFTQRDIYNERAQLREERNRGLSPIQALIQYLKNFSISQINEIHEYASPDGISPPDDNSLLDISSAGDAANNLASSPDEIERSGRYFYRFETDDEQRLTWLFIVHPLSIGHIRRNYDVMLADCTYQTNRFDMPLLNIVGITSTNRTVEFGFCFLKDEKTDTYISAMSAMLELLKKLDVEPSVWLTDKEDALKAALTQLWPDVPQRLCWWHIKKHWKKEARERIVCHEGATADEAERVRMAEESFTGKMENMAAAVTVEAFEEAWAGIKNEYAKYNGLVEYIEREYMPCRHEWADAWCRQIRDFGTR